MVISWIICILNFLKKIFRGTINSFKGKLGCSQTASLNVKGLSKALLSDIGLYFVMFSYVRKGKIMVVLDELGEVKT